MRIFRVATAFWLLQAAFCLDFKARIVNVPEEALEIENLRSGRTRPIERNYQAKVDAKAVGLGPKYGEVHEFRVKKTYEFDVEGLSAGEYKLLVHSHDFNIRQGRFHISVNDSAVVVTEDSLGISGANSTKSWVVSEKEPLIIEAATIKQYEENPRNKLMEMVMQSPLGFIFKNRLYTILFFVCMGLMILPLLVQWINPELAEQFSELQKEAYEKRAERVAAEKRQGQLPTQPDKIMGKKQKRKL